ncbi:hypothetical protein [Desulfovibrio sp. JC010]|uniref:hypothetical protein n=1 Tax=Desulfovibrio sp. JC010 TaxID=2593641 RepID=UPI0013D8027D|nr:hypothetical protein [Desulfovibrio sp. JC010]NDV28114.1 hypothetical protein [Desulfovibrio sp. JC010]
MKKLTLLLIFLTLTIISGCVKSKSINYYSNQKIQAPKIIALENPRTPWVAPIIHELRKRGFKVLRWGSQHQAVQRTKMDKVNIYNEASTRYILYIDGDAYLDQMNRCFGGGFKFIYINADLVDVETNETIANFSDGGYSENCPPLSGTIFNDLADTVAGAWATATDIKK